MKEMKFRARITEVSVDAEGNLYITLNLAGKWSYIWAKLLKNTVEGKMREIVIRKY